MGGSPQASRTSDVRGVTWALYKDSLDWVCDALRSTCGIVNCRQLCLVGCCARLAHSDGGQEVPTWGVRLRSCNPWDRLQQILNGVNGREIDRKSPLPKLLLALDVFDCRPEEAFEFA
jgi:hypothetical protein